jgi:hypothetical protein
MDPQTKKQQQKRHEKGAYTSKHVRLQEVATIRQSKPAPIVIKQPKK